MIVRFLLSKFERRSLNVSSSMWTGILSKTLLVWRWIFFHTDEIRCVFKNIRIRAEKALILLHSFGKRISNQIPKLFDPIAINMQVTYNTCEKLFLCPLSCEKFLNDLKVFQALFPAFYKHWNFATANLFIFSLLSMIFSTHKDTRKITKIL